MAMADDGFYSGNIFVDNFVAKYPLDEILTWDGLKLCLSSKWRKREIKVEGSTGELANTVKLRGVSGVVFSIIIHRTAFKVPAALLGEEAENGFEVEIPFLPLTMENVFHGVPKEQKIETVEQLTEFIHSSLTKSPWVLREDGTHLLPGSAELPGLASVTITTMIQTQDLISIPPNLKSEAAKYWHKFQYNGNTELWGKGKVWTGYASERLIEAVFFNAYKRDMFKAIYGKARYSSLFKSRGKPKLLLARWNQMGKNLPYAKEADTKKESVGKIVNWYFKELFEVLNDAIPKFEKSVADKVYDREIGHWAYYLKNNAKFKKLYRNSDLLRTDMSKAFLYLLDELVVKSID